MVARARSMRPRVTRMMSAVPDVSAFFAKGDSAILSWGGVRPHGPVGKGGCGGGCGGKVSYRERLRPSMSTFVQGSTEFISWVGDSPFRNDSGWTRKPRAKCDGPVGMDAFPEDCGCDSEGDECGCAAGDSSTPSSKLPRVRAAKQLAASRSGFVYPKGSRVLAFATRVHGVLREAGTPQESDDCDWTTAEPNPFDQITEYEEWRDWWGDCGVPEGVYGPGTDGLSDCNPAQVWNDALAWCCEASKAAASNPDLVDCSDNLVYYAWIDENCEIVDARCGWTSGVVPGWATKDSFAPGSGGGTTTGDGAEANPFATDSDADTDTDSDTDNDTDTDTDTDTDIDTGDIFVGWDYDINWISDDLTVTVSETADGSLYFEINYTDTGEDGGEEGDVGDGDTGQFRAGPCPPCCPPNVLC